MEPPKTEFQTWTRWIYNLLRGHHHLRQMRKGLRSNQVPPSLQGMTNFLSQLATPALPTATTATLLRGNASNWLQVNLQILEQHYEGMIATVKTNLLKPVKIDHQKAWLVALRWALGKFRIEEEVVRLVMDDLIGVGLRIDRISIGSPMKAIMDAPPKRPRPRTHEKSKQATVTTGFNPRTPTPDTSTHSHHRRGPSDRTMTPTRQDSTVRPRTTTPLDRNRDSTDQDPPPDLVSSTRLNPLGHGTTLTPTGPHVRLAPHSRWEQPPAPLFRTRTPK